MIQVGEFEKVSFDQFRDAIVNDDSLNFFEFGEDQIKEMYDNIQIPERATAGSAGHDFKIPFTVSIGPSCTVKIPTGIRVSIDEGWWLGILPRSSLGFKYRLQLDNTCGVIDSDYYYSDNEGHIFIKITNDSYQGKIVHLKAGDSFAQGIFVPYGVTYSDNTTAVRNGGMGSTGA